MKVELEQEKPRPEIKVENQENELAPTQPDLQNYKMARDRERRVINPPLRFGFDDMVAFALKVAEEIETNDPRNYVEAINCNLSQNWIVVMYEEINSLQKKYTWVLVEKLKRTRLVSCKWIFKLMEEILGIEKSRFKARLVSRGFTQRERVDYSEVFSLVVKHS